MIGISEMTGNMPWDLAQHLPWQVFMNPAEKWATATVTATGSTGTTSR